MNKELVKLVKVILDEGMGNSYNKEFNLPLDLVEELMNIRVIRIYNNLEDLYRNTANIPEYTLNLNMLNQRIDEMLALNPKMLSEYNSLAEALLSAKDLDVMIFRSRNFNDVVTVRKSEIHTLLNYEEWEAMSKLTGRQYTNSVGINHYHRIYKEQENSTINKHDFIQLVNTNEVVIHTTRQEFIKWYFRDSVHELNKIVEEFLSLDTSELVDYTDLFSYFVENCLNDGSTVIEGYHTVMFIY